jgi:hypothetical protein
MVASVLLIQELPFYGGVRVAHSGTPVLWWRPCWSSRNSRSMVASVLLIKELPFYGGVRVAHFFSFLSCLFVCLFVFCIVLLLFVCRVRSWSCAQRCLWLCLFLMALSVFSNIYYKRSMYINWCKHDLFKNHIYKLSVLWYLLLLLFFFYFLRQSKTAIKLRD